MSSIVLGASGFVGTFLVDALAAAGTPVVAVDILPPRRRLPGVTYVTADVRRPLNAVPAGTYGACYNLAAIHRTPGHPDNDYYETNIWGALHTVRLCERLAVPNLVFTSSISVYGPNEAARTERSEPAPVSPYGKSKLQAEEIQRLWVEGGTARKLVIVRPGTIFGPGEGGNFTRLGRALAKRTFVYPGRRDTIKACGYVGELMRTLDFALARPEPVYLYNFAYPTAYTIADVCAAFGTAQGLPQPLGTIPYGLMHAAAAPFEVLDRLGFHTGIHRERIDKLVRSTFIVPERLVTDGYAFETDLVEGLRRWKALSPGPRLV